MAGDTVAAQGTAVIVVAEPAAVPMQAPAGRKVSILGPEGYAEYRWIVDGQVVSEERIFEYIFSKPGRYTLISQATEHAEPERFDNLYRRYEVDARREHSKVQFGAADE